jgi:uncharacterized protein YehS (DUF1456 family)
MLAGLFLAGTDPYLIQLRQIYAKAPSKETDCKQMLKMLEKVNDQQPLLYGYKGCATMIMAKHSFNPMNKLSYFKRGKNMLEHAISKDSNNIELRYLRLSIQLNAPAFLGYKSRISKDKKLIKESINNLVDKHLVAMIQSVI